MSTPAAYVFRSRLDDGSWSEWSRPIDQDPRLAIRPPDFEVLELRADADRADAIAMLEATGEDFQVNHLKGEHRNNWWRVEIGPIESTGEGSNLPEAAVRAVLAWKEAQDG